MSPFLSPLDAKQPELILAEKPRVLRGGGFHSAASELRAAYRIESDPHLPLGQAGFRIARTCP